MSIIIDAHIGLKQMRDIVKAFSTLSDETRLRILNLLMERECCVCEVMQALKISQTRASRNLGILYDAGFLSLRREGLWSVYSIDRGGAKEYLKDLIALIQKALKSNAVVRQDRERLRKAERLAPGCTKEQVSA